MKSDKARGGGVYGGGEGGQKSGEYWQRGSTACSANKKVRGSKLKNVDKMRKKKILDVERTVNRHTLGSMCGIVTHAYFRSRKNTLGKCFSGYFQDKPGQIQIIL